MEKTNSFNGKLKKYAALAGGVTAAAGASGQVMYTDVNPDEIISLSGTTFYLLDLDNNAVPDMAFTMVSATGVTGTASGFPYTATYAGAGAGFGSTAPATNGWMGISGTATSAGPSAVPASNMIGSSGNFVQSDGNCGIYVTAYIGAPINQTINTSAGNFIGNEGYIGVRFDISGATHYGWARIEVASDGKSMTIKDYAYDATPGTAIPAGDMGTISVNELDNNNQINIVNTYNNRLIVKTNEITNGAINVVAIDGKVVSSNKINNETEIVSLSDLASGIYVVNVTSNETSISKKIYVR